MAAVAGMAVLAGFDMIRPLCKVCNKCLVKKTGKKKADGTSYYLKECCGCHHQRLSGKRHPHKKHRDYMRPWAVHKKDSCEDCGFKAVHACQLDVDHIDGNKTNNHISNLQTLCANCHRLKTQRSKEYLPIKDRPVNLKTEEQ